MRMLCLSLLLLVPALHSPLAGTGPLAAQQTTPVAVFFEIADPDTRLVFRAAVPDPTTGVAESIASKLGSDVRFLRFAANDTAAAYRLTFSFDRRHRDTLRVFDDLGLWVRLDRPGLEPREAYWLTVRDAGSAGTGLGSPEAFGRDVVAKVTQANSALLRTELLRWVPMTQIAAATLHPTLGWMLPFRQAEVCMAIRSEVLVANDILHGGDPLLREYPARVTGTPQNRLFSEPDAGHALDDLRRAIDRNIVTVRGVYVTHYERTFGSGQCDADLVPPGGGFPTGGAR